MSDHRAWVLIDPDQDYEETTRILGVYRTDSDAREAARPYIETHPNRTLEVQERRGPDLLRVWTWDRRDRHWSICYRGQIVPCRMHEHADIEAWQPGVNT
jgi:hypothetical protein